LRESNPSFQLAAISAIREKVSGVTLAETGGLTRGKPSPPAGVGSWQRSLGRQSLRQVWPPLGGRQILMAQNGTHVLHGFYSREGGGGHQSYQDKETAMRLYSSIHSFIHAKVSLVSVAPEPAAAFVTPARRRPPPPLVQARALACRHENAGRACT